MVRLNTVIFLAALALPTGALALEGNALDEHPGFDELLDGADSAGLLASEQQEASIFIETQTGRDVAESGDFHEYREWREQTCPGCQTMRIARLPYFFDPELLRRLGYRWHDKTRLGLAFNSGTVRYGFWGDVREVNSIVGGRSGLVPTLSTVQTT